MESQGETVLTPPTSTMNYVLFNERGLRTGWRLLIFLALTLVMGFALVSGIGLLASKVRGHQGPGAAPSPLLLGLAEVGQLVAVVLSTWIMSFIERRPTGVYGLPLTRSAVSRFAAGYLLWGFLPLTAVLLMMRVLGVFYFGGLAVRGAEVFYWGAAWGLVFLTVGLVEEYLFRGYALYTLAEGIGFWPAAIVLGVLFAAAHIGNGGESRIGILDVLVYGIFASATLWRTGNLWLAVGAHAGWDWGQSFFYGVSDSGYQVPGHLLNPHMKGPGWLSGGSVGPEGSIVTLIFWILMTVGVLVLFRPQKKQLAVGN